MKKVDDNNAWASLPEDVRWRLEKCEGYLDLKMLDRARSEYDAIPLSSRESIPGRMAGLQLALAEKNWSRAAALARELTHDAPSEPGHWIQLAYAVRRADGIESARAILEDARPRFPKIAILPFNLACYECQLGRLDAARKYLQMAIAIEAQCGALALDDEDLKPLWPELSE